MENKRRMTREEYEATTKANQEQLRQVKGIEPPQPRMKPNRPKGKGAIYGLLLLLLLGAIFYGYQKWVKDPAPKPQDQQIALTKTPQPKEPTKQEIDEKAEIEKLRKKAGLPTDKEELAKLNRKEESWDKLRVERDGEHRTRLSDKMIGRVISDKINLNEPIYAGASELNLRRGSATVDFKEPLDEQTTAIAGHIANRFQYFTEIKRLVQGDIIKVNDFKNKKTYTYVVYKNYTVKPTQREVLLDNPKKNARKLLLLTCHDYDSSRDLFKERWIVEAYEVKK